MSNQTLEQPKSPVATTSQSPAEQPPQSEDFKRLLEKSDEFYAFSSIKSFGDAQRMAKALCSSSIVPEQYKGETNIGNCVIAIEMANRIGASVLAVMQNLYIVHGRPAWSSQFLISCINASKRFSPLRYRMTGTPGKDDWGCVAWAIDKSGEKLESPEINIGIAKSEGWYSKNGSKWKTIPELMLRYRVATLFARLYAPELTMGIQTAEEVYEIGPIVTQPDPSRPIFEIPKREIAPTNGNASTAETSPNPGTTVVSEENPAEKERRLVKAVKGLLQLSKFSEWDLMAHLHKNHAVDESLVTLAELAKVAPGALQKVHDAWGEVVKAMEAK
jgi:hypothetical protein